jgi:hypothetical protein
MVIDMDKLSEDDLEFAKRSTTEMVQLLSRIESWLDKSSMMDEFWTNLVVARLHLMSAIKSMDKITGVKIDE